MNKRQRLGADEWRQIIDGQQPSGLTVAAYCREQLRITLRHPLFYQKIVAAVRPICGFPAA
jgi:hypothetical protein